jgi:hypothetical protein
MRLPLSLPAGGVVFCNQRPVRHMNTNTLDSYAHGHAACTASKEELSAILQRAGIASNIGSRVVRLDAGPLMFKLAAPVEQPEACDYEIDADGYGSPPELLGQWCARVSACLRRAGIHHSIVHFDSEDHAITEYRA